MSLPTRLVTVELGDTQVLVEAAVAPGSEPTSGPAAKVMEAFDNARDAVVEIGVKVAHSLDELARRSARPEEMTVQFGLTVATSGTVLVAQGSAEATLAVTMTYRREAT
ncbi:MAG: CU044_2847 family protein [Actinomycetales bacterium]